MGGIVNVLLCILKSSSLGLYVANDVRLLMTCVCVCMCVCVCVGLGVGVRGCIWRGGYFYFNLVWALCGPLLLGY